MKEIKFYCDICNKDISGQRECVTIRVLIAEGPTENLIQLNSWAHKRSYDFMLCEDCVGEKIISSRTTSNKRFSLGDSARSFLKKFRFVKEK